MSWVHQIRFHGRRGKGNERGPSSSGSPLVVSERDRSHTEEVVLYWVLVEQARHERMSDEYKNRCIIDVPPSLSLVKVRDTTVVPLKN